MFSAFVEEVAGQTAVVTGCGPIGLMSIARAQDGRRARRLRHGHQPGAAGDGDDRWAPTSCSTPATTSSARLRAETDGNGVDIVLEMSGSAAALHQGLAAVTNGGRVSLLGTHTVPATIDLSKEVIFKGLRIYGITGRRLWDTWYRTTALLEEGLDMRPIITHRLPLSDYAKAFDLVASGHAGKVVLLPQEESAREDDADRSAQLPGRPRSTSCAPRTCTGRCAIMSAPQAVHTTVRRPAR